MKNKILTISAMFLVGALLSATACTLSFDKKAIELNRLKQTTSELAKLMREGQCFLIKEGFHQGKKIKNFTEPEDRGDGVFVISGFLNGSAYQTAKVEIVLTDLELIDCNLLDSSNKKSK